MTNEGPQGNAQRSAAVASFNDKLTSVLTDLFYPSETDEPVEPVTCYLKQTEPLTISQFKDWQMLPPSIYVEEMPEAEFWEPVITVQDWYGDGEKTRTATFQQLKHLVESELTVRQVFYVGDSEIDVYLLGRLPDSERAGIRTKIVQT